MKTSARSITTVVILVSTVIVFIAIRLQLFSFLEPVDERIAVRRICEREHRDPASVIGVTPLLWQQQVILAGNVFNNRLRVGDVIVRFSDAIFVYTK